MGPSTSSIVALIIAASFSAGLNIYATILTLGLLSRTHIAVLPPGLDSLSHTWVLVASGIMFALEFVTDKVPIVDMVWNLLHTFVRVPIAMLLAYQASSQLSPQMQLAATAIGAGIAFASHSSKTAARAAITPSPEPLSNIAFSSLEDVLAIGLTWLATQHPAISASIAVVILGATFLAVRAIIRAIRRPLRSLGSRPPTPDTIDRL